MSDLYYHADIMIIYDNLSLLMSFFAAAFVCYCHYRHSFTRDVTKILKYLVVSTFICAISQ